MRIERDMDVRAAPDEVWRILADDYAEIGNWARAVNSSAPNPDVAPLDGASVGGRVCSVSFGEVAETIRTYDQKNRVLVYDAAAKAMPFFVRGLTGQWTIRAAGTDAEVSEVGLRFDADLMPPFGLLMGWLMRKQFRKAIDDTLDDLKRFAETGEIHPDKSAALARASA